MDVPRLRRHLLAWYGAERRALPWRTADTDLYATWVSEAMLQQTRVDVVVPYYQRWLARFPTVHALANAAEDEVLQAWAGLGYYSRARNLHAAAKVVAARGWPKDLQQWRTLPGVGPYTAAAVASIAQGLPHACVDGNVVRVVARLTNESGVVSQARVRNRIEVTAQLLLAPRRPGDWNQAMMELGATVCLPRPKCDVCPVASSCAAKAAGTQAQRPVKAPKAKPRLEHRRVAVVEQQQRVLFVRGQTGLLRGMWTLPFAPAKEALAASVLQQSGVAVRIPRQRAAAARHAFSHRTWHMQVVRGQVVGAPGGGDLETRWIPVDSIDEHAIPAAARVALAAVGIAPPVPKTKPKTQRSSARA